METILKDHNNGLPSREFMIALAEKFSEASDRKGKITVQMKQVWNWFQNRRYALRAKNTKGIPEDSNSTPLTQAGSGPTGITHQPATGSLPIPRTAPIPAPVQVPTPIPAPVLVAAPIPAPSVQPAGSATSENSPMEFEAKSARDGAWYDVQCFLAQKNFESNPEVQVRFVGFGAEEDEWVNVRKNVRQRSLPCEASECVAVLPGDLILCFQEGKDQALYYDAHVLDAQRRRHDVRGCRCRFLVRYDHDLAEQYGSEEIVPLRKVCRRPQTDYRLQQLHAMAKASASVNQPKSNVATPVSATPRPSNSNPAILKLPNSAVPFPHTRVATATTPTPTPTTVSSTPNTLKINTVPMVPKASNSVMPVVPTPVPHANIAIAPTGTIPSTPAMVRISPAPTKPNPAVPVPPTNIATGTTTTTVTSTPNTVKINTIPVALKPSNSGIPVVGPAVPQPIIRAATETGGKNITADASAIASTGGPCASVGQGSSASNMQG
ncbi:hypothetical protein ACFE04_022497 [Oxalis oulophora]